MKKVYLTPTLEILEIEAEMMIATSPGIGSGEGEETNPLTNKRQPASNSWNSQNWGEDGE